LAQSFSTGIKMAFKYKDCLEKGLLRKIPPSKDKALGSIKKAGKWFDEAKKSLKTKALDSSVLASYLVFFHSARFDGFREKSHACIARYLEEVYVKTGKLEKKWVELLDHQRELRHAGQYDLSFSATEKEAGDALESAGNFLKRMKVLLELNLKSEK